MTTNEFLKNTPPLFNAFQYFAATECWKELDYPMLSQCSISAPPKNLKKPSNVLTFSGGIEIEDWLEKSQRGQLARNVLI